ncbi:MAG: radical SAM protein [Syntrophales bacterium]|nr:radical SAM protein [Syntrophales bacterium]HOG07928.1 radical SAM protein [Syntrophales bacterium]HOS77212.1 radical SAM protein [Syntrophales bacterium]
MKYEGLIIRPPSEAYSLLLQVTTGCSHNKCTFCPTYRDKKFRIKSREEILEDLEEASHFRRVKRVFLCDGDALIIPQPRLLDILALIRRHLPGIERVSTYANAKSILRKTAKDLLALKEAGLKMVYLGVETGSAALLEKIHKGVGVEQMVDAGRRIKDSGILLSVTVLLGIGGRAHSIEHATETAKILTRIDPDFTGALTVMVVPGTPLYEDMQAGRFQLPDSFGFLTELGTMIARSQFTDCFFTSNHASNYLPIRARLPQEKEETVRMIQEVIQRGDRGLLRPESLRAL